MLKKGNSLMFIHFQFSPTPSWCCYSSHPIKYNSNWKFDLSWLIHCRTPLCTDDKPKTNDWSRTFLANIRSPNPCPRHWRG